MTAAPALPSAQASQESVSKVWVLGSHSKNHLNTMLTITLTTKGGRHSSEQCLGHTFADTSNTYLQKCVCVWGGA